MKSGRKGTAKKRRRAKATPVPLAEMTAASIRRLAKKVVRGDLSALENRIGADVWRVGTKLWALSEEEHEGLEALRLLICGYLDLPDPARPLCLAVFGPPGSGKSFAVKEILEAVRKQRLANFTLPLTTVNLTQLGSSSDLFEAMRGAFGELKAIAAVDSKKGKAKQKQIVPFIFFDEFDAPLDGVELGWLSWFLSPMEDSVVARKSERFELKRAIYVFAGGTAARMCEFGSGDSARFRAAKGPDFVSRLRGYLDVLGPNWPELTDLRRAIVLRHELQQVSRTRGKDCQITDALLEEMLNEGRFRHGARSIRAILETAAAESKDSWLRPEDLSAPHISAVHVDQGPLDPARIGGLIGLSIGSADQKSRKTAAARACMQVASRLLRRGAALGFGGKWRKPLSRELARLGRRISRRTATVETRVEIFQREEIAIPVDTEGVVVVPIHFDPSPGSNGWSERLHQIVQVFRMRWLMSSRCVARILVSGKLSGYSGRMPGILEEAMLALALGQPIYVLGGFGGSAELLGEQMGLAKARSKRPLTNGAGDSPGGVVDDLTESLAGLTHVFRPPGFEDLPTTFAEAISFIVGHNAAGPRWPSNGLSLEENRRLFSSQDNREIQDLIEAGLLRRFRGT